MGTTSSLKEIVAGMEGDNCQGQLPMGRKLHLRWWVLKIEGESRLRGDIH